MRALRQATALALLLVAGAGVLAGPASAVRATGVPAAAHSVAPVADARPASVDDFTFQSFDADYTLTRDAAGHSVLRTVERLTAQFPATDQNRGLRREIPTRYQGHPTSVRLISVTDGDGAARPVETDDEDDVLVVTSAVPEGQYVHGTQTYVLTYEQRDVTLRRDDGAADEFYWDTNGTGWAQPFGQVTARVHLGPGLQETLTGQSACYRGVEGSSTPCGISRTGDTVTAQTSGLGPRENLTVAIGFRTGTFTERDDSYLASPAAWVQLGVLAALLAVVVWVLVLRGGAFRDAEGRPTIIAEYAPPPGVTPLVASNLHGRLSRGIAAQLVDLAVRRRLAVVEQVEQGVFGARRRYLLRLTQGVLEPGSLGDDDLRVLSALFGPIVPGAWFDPKQKDTARARAAYRARTTATASLFASGLRRKPHWALRTLPILAVMGLSVALFVAGAAVLADDRGGALPAVLWIAAPIAFVIVTRVCSRTPFTARGAEVRDHLRGLELYISLAEADRLRVLQSPEGALREPIDPADRGAVLRLTERLLPYAVLFGQEERWAEELGRFYGEQPPDWYAGSGAFDAALFTAGIGSLSDSVGSGYSGSSSSTSSSSDGGSSGGGSSGGGGGGGGGGGV